MAHKNNMDRSLGITDPTAKQFLSVIDLWTGGKLPDLGIPPLPVADTIAEQVMLGLCFRLYWLDCHKTRVKRADSRPKTVMSDRQLRLRRFTAAYQAADGGHTKRVIAAGKAVGIKERAAKQYAADAGLRSKQNGA